jgi:hypothetical protein
LEFLPFSNWEGFGFPPFKDGRSGFPLPLATGEDLDFSPFRTEDLEFSHLPKLIVTHIFVPPFSKGGQGGFEEAFS